MITNITNTHWLFGARLCLVAFVLASANVSVVAQGRGGGRAEPPKSPKEAAPADLTGYWASVVTEDWRYRMLPPLKFVEKNTLGSQEGIPMNAAARKIALAWDPATDEAAAEQCKAYGAPNIMRMPGRIRIAWQDDRTLKLETDAGTQSRLFAFDPSKNTGNTGGDWQGVSEASWEASPGGRGGPRLTGSLKVLTTKLRPGYLRRNGVPYSANATITEYYDRVDENGTSYLVITTTVEDPAYLTEPYLTTTHFKKQADASGWHPSPCSSR